MAIFLTPHHPKQVPLLDLQGAKTLAQPYALAPLPSLAACIPMQSLRDARPLNHAELASLRNLLQKITDAAEASAPDNSLRLRNHYLLKKHLAQLKGFKTSKETKQQNYSISDLKDAANIALYSSIVTNGPTDRYYERIKVLFTKFKELPPNKKIPPDSQEDYVLYCLLKPIISNESAMGKGREYSERALSLAKEIEKEGFKNSHAEILSDLEIKRDRLKRESNDPKAELSWDELEIYDILTSESNAHAAKIRHEKASLTPVNTPEKENRAGTAQAILHAQALYSKEKTALLHKSTALEYLYSQENLGDTSGTCESCGLHAPSHMEKHTDTILNREVVLCPMCHHVEHLDFAGFQQSGKMVWLPNIPQSFLSLLTTLTCLTMPYFRLGLLSTQIETLISGLSNSKSISLTSEQSSQIKVIEQFLSNNEKASIFDLMQEVNKPNQEEASEKQISLNNMAVILKKLQARYPSVFSTTHVGITTSVHAEPQAEYKGAFHVIKAVRELYLYASRQDKPLADAFPASHSSIDSSSPLFWAENLRHNGFLPSLVERTIGKHEHAISTLIKIDSVEKRKAEAINYRESFSEVGTLNLKLRNIEGIRFLPSIEYFSGLILGKRWRSYFQEVMPLESWPDLFPFIDMYGAYPNQSEDINDNVEAPK